MSTSTQARAAENRFATAYDDRALLALVRRILLLVCPAAPLSVTQAEFDQARLTGDEHGAFERVPAARVICPRLGRHGTPFSWAAVKETAIKDERGRIQTLVAASREPEAEVSLRHIFFALNHVARELGLDTLAEDEYEAGRRTLLAAERRQHRAGGVLAELLPTAHQIRTAAGTWDRALAVGELAVLKREILRPRVSFPDGMPVEDAIVAFVEVNGRYPGYPVLTKWMGDCGAKLRACATTYIAHLDAAETILRERGIPVPADRPSRGRPKNGTTPFDYQLPHDGLSGATPRGHGSGRKVETWTTDACIEALADWDRELDPAVNRDTRRWVEDSRGRADRPSRETLRRKGGFLTLLRHAQVLNGRRRESDAGMAPHALPGITTLLAADGSVEP